MIPVLCKECFTVDELRMRKVPLTSKPTVLPRSAFKIVEVLRAEIAEDCVWYDLVCIPAFDVSGNRSRVEDCVVLDKNGFVVVRTAIPSPGTTVEENVSFKSTISRIARYTYLDFLSTNFDDLSARCVKMNMNDQKVYEDRFHLLAPFTSLYTAACLGDGRATISSASDVKNHLRIFR